MKRTIVLLLCISILVLLCGCSDFNEDDFLYRVGVDASEIEGFKCVYSVDKGVETVIEGEGAEDLYSYVCAQLKVSEELTKSEIAERKYIYLLFQDGEPLLLKSNSKSDNGATDKTEVTVDERGYYGVFWILEGDYLLLTGAPQMSYRSLYKLPSGTYERVLEMVS